MVAENSGAIYTAKTSWLFNHREVTLIAHKLERQWLPEVFSGIYTVKNFGLFQPVYRVVGVAHMYVEVILKYH